MSESTSSITKRLERITTLQAQFSYASKLDHEISYYINQSQFIHLFVPFGLLAPQWWQNSQSQLLQLVAFSDLDSPQWVHVLQGSITNISSFGSSVGSSVGYVLDSKSSNCLFLVSNSSCVITFASSSSLYFFNSSATPIIGTPSSLDFRSSVKSGIKLT